MSTRLSKTVVKLLKDIDSEKLFLRRVEFEYLELNRDVPFFRLTVFDSEGSLLGFHPRMTAPQDKDRTIELQFSDELNHELLKRGIRMATTEQETKRIGEHLSFNLSTMADGTFGEDFVNDVLIDFSSKRFKHIPIIAQIISSIKTKSRRGMDGYQQCYSFIEHSITGLGNELVLFLKYPDDGTAFAILASAVTFLLDRRFSLSMRRVLFNR